MKKKARHHHEDHVHEKNKKEKKKKSSHHDHDEEDDEHDRNWYEPRSVKSSCFLEGVACDGEEDGNENNVQAGNGGTSTVPGSEKHDKRQTKAQQVWPTTVPSYAAGPLRQPNMFPARG